MRINKSRKYDRKSILVMLSVDNPNTTEEPSRAAAIDISRSGVAFESSTQFFVGDTVILRFIFKREEIYVFEGIVRRIKNDGGINTYGIKFKNLSFKERRQLKHLVEKFTKKK